MKSFLVDLSPILGGPGESLTVAGEIELEPLEKGDELIVPEGPVALDLTVENVGERSYLLRGRVSAHLAMTCSRCLKAFLRPTTAEVEALFSERPAQALPEGEPEAYPIARNRRIDILPAVAEALVLEAPFAAVCDEGCPGLCPMCGADLAAGPCGCTLDEADPRLDELKHWMEEHG